CYAEGVGCKKDLKKAAKLYGLIIFIWHERLTCLEHRQLKTESRATAPWGGAT
ncbi:uncharacterized protein K441DRAFT_594215, partial [Cenococcum geophilum 1.58]